MKVLPSLVLAPILCLGTCAWRVLGTSKIRKKVLAQKLKRRIDHIDLEKIRESLICFLFLIICLIAELGVARVWATYASDCKGVSVGQLMTTIKVVEALKDQGISRWNYVFKSVNQHAKTNLRSYLQAKRVSTSASTSAIGKKLSQEKMKQPEESFEESHLFELLGS